MNLNSKWAFMFTPNIKGGFLAYDAERSQFSQDFFVHWNINGSIDEPSFAFEDKRQVVGSYIAQNAMGATAKVMKQNVLIRGFADPPVSKSSREEQFHILFRW